jgi:polyisoprenoid-binding protein YceI
MKSNRVVATLLILWTGAAWAAPESYELNREHSDVTFTINHAGLSLKHGWFGDVSGSLKLDTNHLEASSVDVTVAMTSVDTNNTRRDTDLRGANFLDVEHFPAMHFVSTKVSVVNPSALDVTGDLTLHGVTRPLVLHAKINMIGKSPFGGAQTAGFTATGALKRSDFGMKTMLPLIGDDVSITIDTEFAMPRPKQ